MDIYTLKKCMFIICDYSVKTTFFIHYNILLMNKNTHIQKLYCLNDIQAFIKYPRYNYVYNKFDLIRKQNIYCNIVGIYPDDSQYPIIIKPIINLFGMSRDVKLIRNEDEYTLFLTKTPHPSSFWMPYYNTSQHFTCDILMKNGKVLFSNTFQCVSTEDVGIFKKHIYKSDYLLDNNIIHFLENYLLNYTGCVNIEIIDSIIIEIHLRFNGDNYIYKEHPILFNYLNSILNKKYLNLDNSKYKTLQKTSASIIDVKQYYYIPFFIENIDNYIDERENIEKQIMECKNKNADSIINVYYDNIDGLHQQEKKRYCMITIKK